MPTPLLVTDASMGAPALLCPQCQGAYLHLDVIEMHAASGGALRIAATGEDEHSQVNATPVGSEDLGRRHTAVLEMWCETCPDVTRVFFRQHKGCTYVDVETSAAVVDENGLRVTS